jgi:hypothetical protein
MKSDFTPITSVVTFSVDKFRSFPAEIGSSAPLDPVKAPERFEFPQQQTLTAPELVLPPMAAVYETIPGPTRLPTTPAAPAPVEGD